MNEFQATAVMIGLFALRCVLPLVLMAVLGYAMNRLVDRWEAEEAGEARPAAQPAAPRPAAASRVKLPCWVLNNCEETERAGCPAFLNRSVACWIARLQSEGEMPARCADCPLYQQTPAAVRVRFSGD